MGAPPWTSLADHLRSEFRSLDFIRSRQAFLSTFIEELDVATRGKPFDILAIDVWTTSLDSRDALVTHLASWAKATMRRGGLFGQLRAHAVKPLRDAYRRTAKVRKRCRRSLDAACDEAERSLVGRGFDAAWCRLFPKATDAGVRPEDIDALNERFFRELQPVVTDRHEHRAHVFETTGFTVAMHPLGALGDKLAFIDGMLNDLLLVIDRTTTSAMPTNPYARDTARDFVDLLVFGARARATAIEAGSGRERLYDELHRLHDASDGSKCFNAPPFIEELVSLMGRHTAGIRGSRDG